MSPLCVTKDIMKNKIKNKIFAKQEFYTKINFFIFQNVLASSSCKIAACLHCPQIRLDVLINNFIDRWLKPVGGLCIFFRILKTKIL